jgi:hypothetical protein
MEKCCFIDEIPHEPKDEVQKRLMSISRPCSLKINTPTSSGEHVSMSQPNQICLACCMRISILMREITACMRDGRLIMETLRDRPENVLDYLSPSSKVIAQGLLEAGLRLNEVYQECDACGKRDYTQSYDEGTHKGYKIIRETNEKILEHARLLRERK